jgi:hypothetical protein
MRQHDGRDGAVPAPTPDELNDNCPSPLAGMSAEELAYMDRHFGYDVVEDFTPEEEEEMRLQFEAIIERERAESAERPDRAA